MRSPVQWESEGVDDMSVEEYRKAAVDAVQKLSVDVGILTKLEALKEEDLDFLAESAHADACAPVTRKMPVWKILRIFPQTDVIAAVKS